MWHQASTANTTRSFVSSHDPMLILMRWVSFRWPSEVVVSWPVLNRVSVRSLLSGLISLKWSPYFFLTHRSGHFWVFPNIVASFGHFTKNSGHFWYYPFKSFIGFSHKKQIKSNILSVFFLEIFPVLVLLGVKPSSPFSKVPFVRHFLMKLLKRPLLD